MTVSRDWPIGQVVLEVGGAQRIARHIDKIDSIGGLLCHVTLTSLDA
jgi:hypothetical protein